MAPSSTWRSSTSVFGETVRPPSVSSSARSRMISPARSGSQTPAPWLWNPPRMMSSLMYGTSSLTSSGVSISAFSPHAFADCIRRWSSCMRSSVRATSMPPDSLKQSISSYISMDRRVRWVISFECSTGIRKFDACPVEPPGSGSGPLSIRRMSSRPIRARW